MKRLQLGVETKVGEACWEAWQVRCLGPAVGPASRSLKVWGWSTELWTTVGVAVLLARPSPVSGAGVAARCSGALGDRATSGPMPSTSMLLDGEDGVIRANGRVGTHGPQLNRPW